MMTLLLRFIARVGNRVRVRGFWRPELVDGALVVDGEPTLPPSTRVELVRVGAESLELGPADAPFRPWAPPPGLPEELTPWWAKVVEQLTAPKSEFAADVLEMLHELYLGRVAAQVEKLDGRPLAPELASATPKDNLLVALASLLPPNWNPEQLDEDPEQLDKVPTALLAALTGLVFEASLAGREWDSLVGGEHLLIDRGEAKPEETEAKIRRVLQVEQQADGFRLTLLDAQGRALAPDGTWHEIEVHRGHGPSRGQARIIRRNRIDRDNREGVHAIDEMGPIEHLGEQLWWRAEVIDVHGRVIHRGDAVDVRERLDPPPTPEAAQVEWSVADDDTALLKVWLPESADPDDQLNIAVYIQRRSLDACGYYGDADDIALLEGNRALDLDASEQLEPPPSEAKAEAWSAWLERNDAWDPRWAKLGLERVPDQQLGQVTPSGDWDRQLQITGLRELARGDGLRLFVLCERKVASGKVLESLPTPAEHVLLREHPQRMFQLEVIPTQAPARWFVSVAEAQLWGEAIVRHADPADPARVQLGWRHQDPGTDRLPVGGYRVWLRDPVAVGDPVPWRPVLEVQALPPVLASLRPLPGLGEARWTLSSTRVEVDSPDSKPDDPPGKILEAAIAAARQHGLHALQLDDPNEAALGLTDEQKQHLEALRSSYQTSKTTLARAAWHSAMLGVLDARRRVQRFRLPLGQLAGTPTELLAKLATPSVAWAYALDPEGHPYATVLALALPARAHIWAPLFEAPVLALAELPGSRRTLTWNEQRRIMLSWAGLEDRWHHDLQWAIEIRDRYAELREQPGTHSLAAAELDPSEVLTVVVERLEPVVERVTVVPELAAEDDWLAFRLLPPPAWQRAAHNAVNRTRLGHLHIDVERRIGWPLAERYRSALARASEAAPDLGSWREAVRAPYQVWSQEFPRTQAEQEPSVGDESTLIFDRHTPYYHEVQIGARLLADRQVGPVTWAKATRSPLRLGLPELPRWRIEKHDDPELFTLHFGLFTPLLASHLDPEEIIEDLPVSGDPQFPERFADCPIHLLPDLEIELVIHLDLGAPELPLLLPMFCWRGPLVRSAAPPANPSVEARNWLGFHVAEESRASWLTAKVTRNDGMLTKLEVETRAKHEAEIQQRLQAIAGNEELQPIWARLRRGTRWTRAFQVPRERGLI